MLPMDASTTSSSSETRRIVDLNNHAVSLLRKGCLIGALDVLQKASNTLNKGIVVDYSSNSPSGSLTNEASRPTMRVERTDYESASKSPRRGGLCYHRYSYEWVDCSEITSPSDDNHRRRDDCSWGSTETTSLFLCLHAVKVNVRQTCNHHHSTCDFDGCLNGIDWAICYNTGIVNSLIGFRLGDKGRFLLERANHCYKRSQLLAPTDSSADDYLRLLVSAVNNELFCLLELGKYDESCTCLHQMIEFLQIYGPNFVGQNAFERQILLNLLVLSRRHLLAPAA